MKILAIHDAEGNIVASVIRPEDAPPASVAVGPGRMTTEVEAREVKIDPLDEHEESYKRLIEVMQNSRVEVEAKLVTKHRPKSAGKRRPKSG
jgi:hypothetical protein